MTEKTKLLPCPFCKGEAVIKRTGRKGTWHFVLCTYCYSRTDDFLIEYQAIELWNRRVKKVVS
jgi:hypothetical protein